MALPLPHETQSSVVCLELSGVLELLAAVDGSCCSFLFFLYQIFLFQETIFLFSMSLLVKMTVFKLVLGIFLWLV